MPASWMRHMYSYRLSLLLFFLFFGPLDFILEANFLLFFFFDSILLLLLLFLLLHHLSDGLVALFLLFLFLHFLGFLQESNHTIHWLQRCNAVMFSACFVVLWGDELGLGSSLLGNSKDVFHRNVLQGLELDGYVGKTRRLRPSLLLPPLLLGLSLDLRLRLRQRLGIELQLLIY